MKFLVFLLLLGNLLFYAFSQGYFGRPENPDAVRLEKQVLPERMRIVSRGEAPAGKAKEVEAAKIEAPAKAEPAPPEAPVAEPARQEPAKQESAKVEPAAAVAPPVCLAWERLPVVDADRLTALILARFAEFKTTRRIDPGETNGWWVYVPPQANKAEAEKKAGELRLLGVTDYFVIQEGPNRFAISLGVFSTEKGGQDRLAELRDKNVRSARLMPRPGKDGTVSIKATGPAASRSALLDAVAKALPKAGGQSCK